MKSLKLEVSRTNNTGYIFNKLINIEPIDTNYSYGNTGKYGLTLSRGFQQNLAIIYIRSDFTLDDYSIAIQQSIELSGKETYDITFIEGYYYGIVNTNIDIKNNGLVSSVRRNVLFKTCNFCDYELVDILCPCENNYKYGCEVIASRPDYNVYGMSIPKFYMIDDTVIGYNYNTKDAGYIGSEQDKHIWQSFVESPEIYKVGDYIFIQDEKSSGAFTGYSYQIVAVKPGQLNQGTYRYYFSTQILGLSNWNYNAQHSLAEYDLNSFDIGVYSPFEKETGISVQSCKGNIVYSSKGKIVNKKFNKCFKNLLLYDGANGNTYNIGFDEDTHSIYYSGISQPFTLGGIQEVSPGTRAIIKYGNFILYGNNRKIGGSYIAEGANSTGGISSSLVGNIFKSNVGWHINPDGTFTAYTQYGGGLFFLGSAEQDSGLLYEVGLKVENSGQISDTVKDMEDQARLAAIKDETKKITVNDYVYMSSNDRVFNIIINYSDNNNTIPVNTKILTWHKEYKIRTVRKLCGILVSKVEYFKGYEVRYGKSGIFHRGYKGTETIPCGSYDSIVVNGNLVKKSVVGNISTVIGDGGSYVFEGFDSFNDMKLDTIESQFSTEYLHNRRFIDLVVDGMSEIWQTKTISLEDNGFFNLTDEEYDLKCYEDKLKDCVKISDRPRYDNVSSYYDIPPNDCFCPRIKPVHYGCITTNPLHKGIGPMFNIKSKIDMVSNAFNISLQFADNLIFYGWKINYDDMEHKYEPCMITNKCCEKDLKCCNNSKPLICQ